MQAFLTRSLEVKEDFSQYVQECGVLSLGIRIY
jgi:hypothetical protein